jgi:hypothetical protein
MRELTSKLSFPATHAEIIEVGNCQNNGLYTSERKLRFVQCEGCPWCWCCRCFAAVMLLFAAITAQVELLSLSPAFA